MLWFLLGFRFYCWAHHMYTVEWMLILELIYCCYYDIAVPTGIKIFSLVSYTLSRFYSFFILLYFLLLVSFFFSLLWFNWYILSNAGIDVLFMIPITFVAHFHYCPFYGCCLALFAAFYYWFFKITGFQYNEQLAYFILSSLSLVLT